MKTTTEARIYCGTYAKYNAGSIAGQWLALSDYRDRDAFMEACREIHSDEADPELMFQDFEGFPRCFYSESSAPGDIVWEWLDLSDDEKAAFSVYAENIGDDADIDGFRDAYAGTADSEAAFAEQTAEECGEIPRDMPGWVVIDWQASWDGGLSLDYFSGRDENGTMHFFRNC